LKFRLWTPDDLSFARALFGDPRVTALVGGPFDEATVVARLDTELANQRDHGIAYWPIQLYGSKEIGCCGLKPRDPGRRIYELGFYLLPAYWGQGFAAEAGASVAAFAFTRLHATGLFAGHHPENQGSRRTLEKIGFRYSHHEHYPPTGLEHPGYEMLPW
jgi:RimJ/RimL family protein N-acetyltransferase